MKIFSDVRVAHHLGIGVLVATATFGFATSAQARVLLGSPGPAPLSTGLVGYWPLDGAVTNWTSNTTRDISGNGNTARFYLASTSTSPVTGKIGQAIHPNGNITVPHSTSINLGSTLSVSFWLKGTAIAPWDGLIGKTDFATGWLIQNADSNGSRDLYVRMDTSALVNQNCTDPVGITNVLDGTWHHVVLVITNGTCTLYKDSVRGTPGTFNVGTGFANPAVDLTFEGGDSDATDSTYDDVRLFNRVLTQAEIRQLYNLGTANAGHANTVALSNGLVGYWPLDGSATNWRTNTTADLSGQGNTGSLVSLGTTTAPVAGKIGQALKFDGLGAVQVSSLTIPTITTVAAWVRIDTSVYQPGIVSNRSGGSFTFSYDGGHAFVWNNGTGALNGTVGITDGKWHHVVFSGDGTTGKIYVDGSLDVSGPYARTSSTGIGYIGWDTNNFFKGPIDDVRIYNRALSAAEVKQLYNTGAANIAHSNVWVSAGLVGYWTFDGSATNWRTNTTADLSGSGNTGTLISMSTTTSPVAGKIGQAFTFNGSQAVRIEDSPSLDVGDVVSYSMWVKRARIAVQEIILSMSVNAAVGTFESNNTVAFHKHLGGTVLATTGTITDTKFHYLVFTKNGAMVRIYIDGALAASTNSAGLTFSDNSFLKCIGLDSVVTSCQNLPFMGVVDDFRIYNRALSAAEVQQLYNAGK